MKRAAVWVVPVRAWLGLALASAIAARAAVSPQDSGFTVKGWDNADGLSPNPISALARTADGYLWLATSAGLVRFDGVRFVTLTTNTVPALGDNRITCMHVDRDGILWVGTRGGAVSRREGGVFTAVPVDEKLRGIPIYGLAKESDGTLWVATRGKGIVRQRGMQRDFFGTTNGLPSEIVSRPTMDRQGKLWAISAAKLIALEQGRWQMPSDLPVPDGEILALAAARDGGLWVATTFPHILGGRGGRVFKLKEGRWEAQLGPYLWTQDSVHSQVTTLLEDHDGRVWAGTPGAGVFVWDAESKWQRLAMVDALAQLECTAFVSDGEDGLWIGTMGGDLFQARKRPVKTLDLPQIAEKNTVLNAHVTRDGSVWIGTDGSGLFRLRDGKFDRYTEEQGLTNGHIGVVFEDSRTNLWVGTWNGLFRLNGERFEPVPGPPPLRSVVLTLCEDRKGGLWVGTGAGVVWFDQHDAKVFGRKEGVDHFYIRAVTQDTQGRVWLAIMDRGLYLLQEGRFTSYGVGKWQNQDTIRALHADADGTLWIATFGSGLARLKEGEFTQWRVRDGLPGDRIVAVTEDSTGNLWVSSEEGIFGCPKTRFDNYQRGVTPRLLFWHMSVADGLQTKRCSGAGQPVIGRSGDGRLWIPDWGALAVFDPADIPRDLAAWPVLMEEAIVDGKLQSPSPDGILRVKSSARSFEFHYTSPNLRTPERMRFRYRLKDSNLDWVEADQRRTAYYGRLRPGDYEFSVMAGSPTGVWGESPQIMRLTVEPLMWERRTVQIAAALLLLGLVGAAVWRIEHNRSQRKLQLAEAQQAMERERRRIARDLHDDLGAGLAEVVLLGELARQDNVSSGDVKAHVFEMTEKTRQLVTAMDEIVWTVNPRNDTIPNLASYVAEHSRKFFSPTPIHCRLDIASDLPALPVPAAARHNLFLAVKEALHNAVKHSHAREVWLRMHWANDEFTLEVQDDGRGFDPQKSTQDGDGLENMQHRLEAVGGRATIQSQPSGGTAIRFIFPVPRDGNTAR